MVQLTFLLGNQSPSTKNTSHRRKEIMAAMNPHFSFGLHNLELLHFVLWPLDSTCINKLEALYFRLTKSSTVKLFMAMRVYFTS